MSKISKKKLSPAFKNDSLSLFFKKIKMIQTVSDLENFLDTFFTSKEKDIILRRLAVILLLNRDKTYKEIGNTLEISKATISKIKQIMSGDGYGRNLHKIKYAEFYTKSGKKNRSEKFLPKYKGAPSLF